MKSALFLPFCFVLLACSSQTDSNRTYETNSQPHNSYYAETDYAPADDESTSQIYDSYDRGYEWATDNDVADFDECQNEFGTGDAEDGCNEYVQDNYAGDKTFGGYECTEDCGGHQAGYNWADRQGITNPEDCGGNSQSFIEGCQSYVADQQ